MSDDTLAVRVERTIQTQRLFARHARVVVGVSGGADSVGLLHLLCELRARWSLTLHVAHLDHGLRADSAEDAAFVQALGVSQGIPTTIERRDVAARCTAEGWSLEDGARRMRYQFFLEVSRRHAATHIALAHTADDQAETVLMRILRGSGLLGLGAIPMTRPLDEMWIVRPLLEVWRREVVDYLQVQGAAYRDDASNRDPRFVRNRIRHELLPLLEERYNPNVKGALTQLAAQSQTDYAYLQRAAQRQWKRTAKVGPPSQVTIAIATFLRQPKALQCQLVRQAIQQVHGDLTQFEFRHWIEIERLVTERPAGSCVDLPGGVQWRREHDRVTCRQLTPQTHPVAVE